jgi:hypothetical protein
MGDFLELLRSLPVPVMQRHCKLEQENIRLPIFHTKFV